MASHSSWRVVHEAAEPVLQQSPGWYAGSCRRYIGGERGSQSARIAGQKRRKRTCERFVGLVASEGPSRLDACFRANEDSTALGVPINGAWDMQSC